MRIGGGGGDGAAAAAEKLDAYCIYLYTNYKMHNHSRRCKLLCAFYFKCNQQERVKRNVIKASQLIITPVVIFLY